MFHYDLYFLLQFSLEAEHHSLWYKLHSGKVTSHPGDPVKYLSNTCHCEGHLGSILYQGQVIPRVLDQIIGDKAQFRGWEVSMSRSGLLERPLANLTLSEHRTGL